jgi:hypothetical protein
MNKPDREIFIRRRNRQPAGAGRSAVWSIEIKGPPIKAALNLNLRSSSPPILRPRSPGRLLCSLEPLTEPFQFEKLNSKIGRITGESCKALLKRAHSKPPLTLTLHFFGAHFAWAVPSLELKYYIWKTSKNTGFFRGYARITRSMAFMEAAPCEQGAGRNLFRTFRQLGAP